MKPVGAAAFRMGWSFFLNAAHLHDSPQGGSDINHSASFDHHFRHLIQELMRSQLLACEPMENMEFKTTLDSTTGLMWECDSFVTDQVFESWQPWMMHLPLRKQPVLHQEIYPTVAWR